MEVVGVVLGALPLAIEAVKSYQEFSQTVKSYRKYNETLENIKNKLFLQQRILETTWEDFTGIKRATPEEIELRLKRLEPQDYSAFMGVIKHLNRMFNQVLEKLDVDCDGKPKWSSERPERISWEWKRVKNSFGRRDTKELFDEINQWNHALKLCLSPRREIPSDKSDPLITSQAGKFDEAACNSIRRNADILHESLAKAWCDSHTDIHISGIDIDWHQRGFDSQEGLLLSLPGSGMGKSERTWHRIDATFYRDNTQHVHTEAHTADNLPTNPPKSVHRAPLSKKRGVSFFGLKSTSEKPAIIETPLSSQEKISVSIPKPTLVPITSLCSLRETNSWNGYLKHPDPEVATRVQLEKQKKESNCTMGVHSLRSLISSSNMLFQVSGSQTRPLTTRRDRYSIAAATVWTVLLFCGTPWLEQTWLNKDDLWVFDEETGTARRKFQALTHNFSSQKTQSSDDYRTIYVKHETLFSLGILLIELGLNRPFEAIRRQYNEVLNTPASTIDDFKIADLTLGAVRSEVGDSYGDAIERCLGCHFLCPGGTRDFTHAKFRNLFYDGVVAPIQATYDSLPKDIHSL
ncbi:hypothetical protein BJ166DRAFT_525398 [Pestalotiopsis sp. NC0098]|nr:hypothetical protein BJ166DRAFT_525398 [Pestalotiopsis sp. NC0098]